jgi:hypothetical protein
MKMKFLSEKFDIKMGQSIRIDILKINEKYPEGFNVSRKYSIVSSSS